MSRSYDFGERVLAYHGPLMYEAKVLKIFDPDNRKVLSKKHSKDGRESIASSSASQAPRHVVESADTAYFIHYKGWKQSWDEWVFEERLLPATPENESLAEDLRQKYTKKSGKNAIQMGQSEKPEAKAPKKPRKDPSLMPEEEYLTTPEVSIPMPPSLKAALVDDWEFITKDLKLVPLPRSPNVSQVLAKYKAFKESQDISSGELEILGEIVKGIELYFNKCLGNILLYRQERHQYFDMYRDDKSKFVASEVYGTEHLLRLFVALPGLIAQTSMDKQAISTLRDNCDEFLNWISDNEGELILEEYQASA